MAMDSGDDVARTAGTSILRGIAHALTDPRFRERVAAAGKRAAAAVASGLKLANAAFKSFIGSDGEAVDVVAGQDADGALVVANSFSSEALRDGFVAYMEEKGFDAAATEIPDPDGRFEAVVKAKDQEDFQRAVDATEDWLEEQSFLAAADEWAQMDLDRFAAEELGIGDQIADEEWIAGVERSFAEAQEAERAVLADGPAPTARIDTMAKFEAHLNELHEARMVLEGVSPALETAREAPSALVR